MNSSLRSVLPLALLVAAVAALTVPRSRLGTIQRQKRSTEHIIRDCMLVTSEPGHYFFKSVGEDPTVCGVYLMTDPDKIIQLQFDYLDLPCNTGGLVSFVDGWELNGGYFPEVGEHRLRLEDRVTEFCGLNRPARAFISSQNAALVQYRVPKRARGFSFRVTFLKNPTHDPSLPGKSSVEELEIPEQPPIPPSPTEPAKERNATEENEADSEVSQSASHPGFVVRTDVIRADEFRGGYGGSSGASPCGSYGGSSGRIQRACGPGGSSFGSQGGSIGGYPPGGVIPGGFGPGVGVSQGGFGPGGSGSQGAFGSGGNFGGFGSGGSGFSPSSSGGGGCCSNTAPQGFSPSLGGSGGGQGGFGSSGGGSQGAFGSGGNFGGFGSGGSGFSPSSSSSGGGCCSNSPQGGFGLGGGGSQGGFSAGGGGGQGGFSAGGGGGQGGFGSGGGGNHGAFGSGGNFGGFGSGGSGFSPSSSGGGGCCSNPAPQGFSPSLGGSGGGCCHSNSGGGFGGVPQSGFGGSHGGGYRPGGSSGGVISENNGWNHRPSVPGNSPGPSSGGPGGIPSGGDFSGGRFPDGGFDGIQGGQGCPMPNLCGDSKPGIPDKNNGKGTKYETKETKGMSTSELQRVVLIEQLKSTRLLKDYYNQLLGKSDPIIP